jgi:hypothetical protein
VNPRHAAAAVLLTCSISVATAVLFDPPSQPVAPAPTSERLGEAAGRIEAIQEGELTLRGKHGSLRLRVDPTTTVFISGRTGSIRDLTRGLPIRAVLAEPDGVAQWIEADGS